MSGWRGHNIQFDPTIDEWRYEDTRQIVKLNAKRSCGYCGRADTSEGYDGCIGKLPNVMNACCGHGEVGSAYVQLSGMKVLRGKDAYQLFRYVAILREIVMLEEFRDILDNAMKDIGTHEAVPDVLIMRTDHWHELQDAFAEGTVADVDPKKFSGIRIIPVSTVEEARIAINSAITLQQFPALVIADDDDEFKQLYESVSNTHKIAVMKNSE